MHFCEEKNLYYTLVTYKKERGQRKKRTRRYVVLAATPGEAAHKTFLENKHRADDIEVVKVDDDPIDNGIMAVGWGTE